MAIKYGDYVYYEGTNNPVVGIYITIYDGGTTNLASLVDINDLPAANPTLTDQLGHFSFYAAAGDYDVWMNGAFQYKLSLNAGGTGGGGHTIEDEGTPLTQRTNLNFVGASVAVTDDLANDATVVTISASGGDVVGPAVAVDSNFAAFDSTTGKLIKDSGRSIAAFDTFESRLYTAKTGDFSATKNKKYTVSSVNPVSVTLPSAPIQSDFVEVWDIRGAVSGVNALTISSAKTIQGNGNTLTITDPFIHVRFEYYADFEVWNILYVTNQYLTSIEKTAIANIPTLPAIATGAEVVTGTDNAKMVTAKAIKDAGIKAAIGSTLYLYNNQGGF
jgi:hypothetical protein